MEPIARIEIFLAVIAGESYELPVPQTRVELFLANIAGESYELPAPEARVELYLAKILGQNVTLPVPQSRIDRYLAAIAGEDVEPPEFWITRIEYWLAKWAEGSGGQIVTVTGVAPLLLERALAHPIHSLTQYGLCTQASTPTPDAPVDIICNNGAIKVRRPSGMPIAYQMVEWLKPSGSIAITGFKTKSTQEIETVFYREQRGASYLYASDSATSGTTNTTAYLTTSAGNWRWDGKSYSVSVSAGIKITSIQNNDGVWLNDTRVGWYTDPGDFVSTNDLRLSSVENTTVRIYSMTIREGETVTLDLVPVQRVTDNAYGFYDKVSGNFYTNADATFDAGDQIDDPVEIYTDGTDEVLTVRGKNLFDPTKVLFGYYRNSSTGDKRTSSANFMSSDDGYIPCLPDTAYTFVGVNKTNGTYSKYNTIYFFDSAKNYLGASSYQIDQPTTGTTPSNCRYLQVRSNPFDTISVSIQEAFQRFNWQLELGSTATDYEPYHAQTVTDVPMLLSVDGYADTVEIISGLFTYKVGVLVLDGTEDWRASGNLFYADIATDALEDTHGCYCTHFKGVATNASANYDNEIKVGTNVTQTARWARVQMYPIVGTYSDLAAFKAFIAAQYAAGTPVIVLYPLATETTEQTQAHALHTSEGTVIVDVTANVSPVELAAEFTQASA